MKHVQNLQNYYAEIDWYNKITSNEAKSHTILPPVSQIPEILPQIVDSLPNIDSQEIKDAIKSIPRGNHLKTIANQFLALFHNHIIKHGGNLPTITEEHILKALEVISNPEELEKVEKDLQKADPLILALLKMFPAGEEGLKQILDLNKSDKFQEFFSILNERKLL